MEALVGEPVGYYERSPFGKSGKWGTTRGNNLKRFRFSFVGNLYGNFIEKICLNALGNYSASI